MLVCIVRPKWFLMENVPLAARSDAWADARAMLVRAGYGLTETKLNAAFYGVAQDRKRLFVVGRLGEADGFLESALAAARTPESMKVRDLLGNALGPAFYMHPRHTGKRGIWSVDEPAPTVRGSSRRPIPATYEPHPADAAILENGYLYVRPTHAGRGVLSVDESFCTVTRSTFEGLTERYILNPHPKDPVPATVAAVPTREQIMRFQGFPIGWDWSAAGKRAAEQMVANAVPAPQAEVIGRVILAREAGESIPEIQGRFGQWLRRSKGFSGQAVRNGKSRVNRARRLLGGRTFPTLAAELAALDAAQAFAALPTGTRSDLRKALRLYREWQTEPKGRGKEAAPPASVEDVAA
jgi:DNA (cytosine-5)-methyltransferase 1